MEEKLSDQNEISADNPADDSLDAGAAATPNCPPGLEYLLNLNQLVIKPYTESTQVTNDFSEKNKYKVIIKYTYFNS